jgi:hypothetical protein
VFEVALADRFTMDGLISNLTYLFKLFAKKILIFLRHTGSHKLILMMDRIVPRDLFGQMRKLCSLVTWPMPFSDNFWGTYLTKVEQEKF